MNQPKIFIDQTNKESNRVKRLTPEFEVMNEAKSACKDLNKAFPHYKHTPTKVMQVAKPINDIINEATNEKE